jgi:hypothetical protein
MVDKMSVILRHADTCKIRMAKVNKTVDAVVDQFIFEQVLDVVLNKSVKLKLKWNGRCYEGRSAGMDIESDGPTVTKTQTGLRG